MYEHAAQAMNVGLAGNPGRPARQLESLAAAVQRVNTANVTISHFLARFHGDQPAPPLAGATGEIESAQPHSVNLDRLFGALDRLESSIAALDQIG